MKNWNSRGCPRRQKGVQKIFLSGNAPGRAGGKALRFLYFSIAYWVLVFAMVAYIIEYVIY